MPTATRWCGVGLILLAIILFSRVQSTSKHEGRHWLLPTLGAFLCAGASQCCANFPSYEHHAQVSCLYRLYWTQLGVFATFAIDSLLTRKKWRPQGTLLPVLILSAVNVVSLPFFFYRGLNIVAQCGSGSIGYPIAIGTSIAGFFMYSRMILRERINGISVTGLLAVLLGIIIISMA
jgi:multidrug transporter EmrE-like cation transporter